MLRRDSSSLIPRDNVRFLGEPLLSTVTECIFNVLYLLLVYVGATSESSERYVCFLRSGSDAQEGATESHRVQNISTSSCLHEEKSRKISSARLK